MILFLGSKGGEWGGVDTRSNFLQHKIKKNDKNYIYIYIYICISTKTATGSCISKNTLLLKRELQFKPLLQPCLQ